MKSPTRILAAVVAEPCFPYAQDVASLISRHDNHVRQIDAASARVARAIDSANALLKKPVPIVDRHEVRDCALLLIAALAVLGMVAKWNLHQLSVWQGSHVGGVR